MIYRITAAILFICFFADNTLLAQAVNPAHQYVEILLAPKNQNWNFETSEKAVVDIVAHAAGIPLNDVRISFEAGNEMMPPDIKDSTTFTNGKASIRIGTMDQPGFRSCKVNFTFEGKTYDRQLTVGFSPERIKPTVKKPVDFESFWDKNLSKGELVEHISETTLMPDLSTDRVDVFWVKLHCATEGNYIYGYLCKPKKEGKHPALLVPPGAGVKRTKLFNSYAEQGFTTFFIDIHGLSPLADDETVKAMKDSLKNHVYSGMEDPENYYYKKVYLSCIRAIDYLCMTDDVDCYNIGVCGESQGGALAIVTAALDKRVKFVTAFYPSMSDLTGYLHGRAGGCPAIFSPEYSSKLPVPIDVAVNTLSYYDVANFAQQLNVPVFYSYGYNDDICSATSVSAIINSIQAEKEVVITPTSGHFRFAETNAKSIEWMKKQLDKANP